MIPAPQIVADALATLGTLSDVHDAHWDAGRGGVLSWRTTGHYYRWVIPEARWDKIRIHADGWYDVGWSLVWGSHQGLNWNAVIGALNSRPR